MAKKKNGEREPSWSEKIEAAIRDAVSAVPGIMNIPEKEWCSAVIEAVDNYKFGIAMRLGELSDDDEDDDEDDE